MLFSEKAVPNTLSDIRLNDQRLRQLAGEFSPLFDRLGRALTDLAPQLRHFADQTGLGDPSIADDDSPVSGSSSPSYDTSANEEVGEGSTHSADGTNSSTSRVHSPVSNEEMSASNVVMPPSLQRMNSSPPSLPSASLSNAALLHRSSSDGDQRSSSNRHESGSGRLSSGELGFGFEALEALTALLRNRYVCLHV